MFRLRNVAVLVLLIGVVYALAPAERKKRWRGKLRELFRALALSLVIYWIYMLFLFFFRRA
jgi:ABC-type antimicrobial peptide transport system permease subunit